MILRKPIFYSYTCSIQKYRARFLLEPRSLFIFTDEHYKVNFHGIDEDIQDVIINPKFINEDNKYLAINNIELTNIKFESNQEMIVIPREEERLSLTIRYVPLQK